MNRSSFLALFALLSLLMLGGMPSSVSAGELSKEDSEALVKEIESMMAEFEEGKTETLLKKTHPALVKMMGGEETLTKMTNQAVAGMKESGVVFIESTMGKPTETYEAGEEIVTFVPRVSVMEVQGQKVKSTGFMIAIQAKDNGDWFFLDGSGLRRNPELLWELLPDLTREVVLPPNSMEVVE